MRNRNDRGALHLVGIVMVLLLGAALFVVSSLSHELTVMRSTVEEMGNKIELLELRVKNLEGAVVP